MAIIINSDQYAYTGRGPIDSKALVKTFSDLLSTTTWTINNKIAAYNGMLTAVWLNKEDTAKNGVYILFDPAVTSAIKVPDVTNESNWHKLAELSDLTEFTTRLSTIESELSGIKTRLASLEADKVTLRRDNDYNYKSIETTYVPTNNEICLVDIAGYGIRVKIGDGESTFAELSYIDEPILKNIDSLIIKGYFYQNKFYSDLNHSEELQGIVGRIYIDAASSRLYTYDGVSYNVQLNKLPNATAEVAGMVKLYDTTGQNTDGTMTQRAITDELDDKFEMLVDKDDELLIFDKDLY
jgi:hypothetical protein